MTHVFLLLLKKCNMLICQALQQTQHTLFSVYTCCKQCINLHFDVNMNICLFFNALTVMWTIHSDMSHLAGKHFLQKLFSTTDVSSMNFCGWSSCSTMVDGSTTVATSGKTAMVDMSARMLW